MSEGPATGRQNEAVIDPTVNVRELVAAQNRRQDDLRAADAEHLREIIRLEREHATELRKAEADRLDAIRAVDQQNIAQRAAVQELQQQALAKTVLDTSETLRKQVETTAQASDAKTDSKFSEMSRAIASLQEAQFRNVGAKEQVTDAREVSGARLSGTGTMIAAFVGLTGLMLSVIGTGLGLYIALH